jgi:hypothetical protein
MAKQLILIVIDRKAAEKIKYQFLEEREKL